MPTGVYTRTKKHREIISKAMKGHPIYKSKERNANLSKALKGRVSPMKGKKHSEITKKKISESHKGLNTWSKGSKRSEEFKKKHSEIIKKAYEEKEGYRLKISEAKQGEKNPSWKGGISPMNKRVRSSLKYKEWKKKVFERENYTCQITGSKKNLIAHHVMGFNTHPKKRFEVKNGVALTKEIHKEFHKRYGRGNNTLVQLIDFTLYKKIIEPTLQMI